MTVWLIWELIIRTLDNFSGHTSLEVFRNEILAAWQKDQNVKVLISDFMNSEIRISTFKFSPADKLLGFYCEKSLLTPFLMGTLNLDDG